MTARPNQPAAAAATASGDPAERDERVSDVIKSFEVVHAELPDDLQRRVMDIVVNAYERIVYRPTRKPWRKEDFKLLEREVERTSLRSLAEAIKKDLDRDKEFEGLWHVAIGRSFSLFVTHERVKFIELNFNDATVVCWQHGA